MKNIFLVTMALITTAFLVFSCTLSPPPKPFSVDINSTRYKVGETEAYFERPMSIGKIKKTPVTVYYYPADDAVCLQFRVMYISCNQFWTKKARDAYASALNQYKEEFEQKKLVDKGRKTRDVYGSVDAFFTWKKTPVSYLAKGNPKIGLGYQFRQKSVLFTTTQGESYYEDPNSRNRSGTSPVLLIYYTRAQADVLAEMFSQEKLQSLIGGVPAPATDMDSDADTGDGYRELD
jgi:hypothetical protein